MCYVAMLLSSFLSVLSESFLRKTGVCKKITSPTKCEWRQVIENKHYGSKVSNRSAKTSVRWNALGDVTEQHGVNIALKQLDTHLLQ